MAEATYTKGAPAREERMRKESLEHLRRVIELAPRWETGRIDLRDNTGNRLNLSRLPGEDPWFQSQGFRWSKHAEVACFGIGWYGYSACTVFFSITERNAIALFCFDDPLAESLSQKEILDNIDRLLRGEPAQKYTLVDHDSDAALIRAARIHPALEDMRERAGG